MSTQSDALRLMLEAIGAMRAAGYGQDDVHDLVTAAFQHLAGDSSTPYAFGRCTNCGRLILAWSPYQWALLVRQPCPRCGQKW